MPTVCQVVRCLTEGGVGLACQQAAWHMRPSTSQPARRAPPAVTLECALPVSHLTPDGFNYACWQGDGGVKKTVITPGTGWESPEAGDEVFGACPSLRLPAMHWQAGPHIVADRGQRSAMGSVRPYPPARRPQPLALDQ